MQNKMKEYERLNEDYQRIEQALAYIEERRFDQPGLSQVAESIGLSEYHFQRLFTRWVGISPKRFLQFLTKEYAKGLLDESGNVLDVTYQAGLSGPGRLHDLFVTCDAVTPGEYKQRGFGLTIDYGFHPTPFGECLLALTSRGICGLAFVEAGDRRTALRNLRSHWQKATIHQDQGATEKLIGQVFPLLEQPAPQGIKLYLNGTNFQIKVWEALLRIPAGKLVTYSDIAQYIGKPGAARAVGSAVGNNPVSVLIPCHRVIRKMGVFGDYRWGATRKKALLGWEFSRMVEGAG